MNKRFTLSTPGWICLMCLLLTSASCIPMKKIRYLQEKQGIRTDSVTETRRFSEYQVRPGDNLYIRIIGLDEKVNSYFNAIPANSTIASSGGSDAGVFLQSYTVSPKGVIELPIVGAVPVSGKTLAEVQELLQKSVDEYLKESTVIVKFVSFDITLLGEVRRPGKFAIYQNRINIFEALGLAGDMTHFANRSAVVLVRQMPGKTLMKRIDLTDKSILDSEEYYLRPNDIVYVEPLKGRAWTFEAFPYTLFFSTITTTLLIMNFFK